MAICHSSDGSVFMSRLNDDLTDQYIKKENRMNKDYGVRCEKLYVKTVGIQEADGGYSFIQLGEDIKLFTFEEAKHVAKYCGGEVVHIRENSEPSCSHWCPHFPFLYRKMRF